jgi:arylsulfatase
MRDDTVPRHILPIPDVPPVALTTFDAKDPATKFPPIRPVRPPAGAPNVLVILLDDVGFGASSAFGGPCNTPNAERLAANGLKYTRFHTTALCSPTRAALIAGRNHHTVGMGAITEFATSAPGYNSMRPNTCSPLPEILKLNGYATAHIGKCHEVPVWETSPAGPMDRWPMPGNGFEYFYGFFGGETDQWYPTLREGITPLEPWGTPEQGYHLTPDLTQKAIAWIGMQKSLAPDKPFFMYFATGATHAPHHVPKEWADKYKGQFDDGWDALRERTFKRQKDLGVIPKDAELTKRSEGIPAWDEMDDALKPVMRRQMENYAGFLEHTDHSIGVLLDALEQQKLLDDTLVYLIIGDNGASAEGSLKGTFNEIITLSNMGDEVETPEFLNAHIDKIGGPDSMPHYAVGWAHAMNTPYQWTKQIGSHWGGTRNGTIVHWPKGIQAKGETRSQFCHVIDVAQTVLEAAGISAPTMVNGVLQKPMEGVSMLYTFDDAKAAERHTTQYFEMICNRGIYHEGWSAVTKHRTPWITTGDAGVALDDDVWELYDGSKDWTQSRDLSKQMPDKLHHLQQLFILEASKYNVFPLDDRGFERVVPAIAGRPTLVGDRQVLLPGMGGIVEQHVVDWRNRSWQLTGLVDVGDKANGVILNLGGSGGGWSLYLREGVPTFCYNLFGIERTYVRAAQPASKGEHQVRIEFKYDGGGVGKGGNFTLFLDGKDVGNARVERTEGIGFGYEYTQVGRDAQSPVTDDYVGDSKFDGTIHWVEMEGGKDSQAHLVDPESIFRYAMARQ